MTEPLGWHWLAQVTGCAAPLDDVAHLEQLLTTLSTELALTVMAPPRVQAIEGGFAGIVLLGESHAAIHTRVAERAALVDVFSCVPLDPAVAEGVIRAALRPEAVVAELVERRAP